MLFHARIRLVDKVGRVAELRIGEDGRACYCSVGGEAIHDGVVVRPELLAGSHKLTEREGASADCTSRFVTY